MFEIEQKDAQEIIRQAREFIKAVKGYLKA